MQASQAITHMPLNMPSQVYKAAMPFLIFGELRNRKITNVVILCTEEEYKKNRGGDLIAAYKTNNLKVRLFPIQNYSVPSKQDMRNMRQLVHNVFEEMSKNDSSNTYVHCMGGNDTGLVIGGLARLAFNIYRETATNLPLTGHMTGALETPKQKENSPNTDATGQSKLTYHTFVCETTYRYRRNNYNEQRQQLYFPNTVVSNPQPLRVGKELP